MGRERGRSLHVVSKRERETERERVCVLVSLHVYTFPHDTAVFTVHLSLRVCMCNFFYLVEVLLASFCFHSPALDTLRLL